MIRSLVVLAVLSSAAAADLTFERYHDYDETIAFLEGLASKHPGFVRLETAGKSVQGRDLRVAIVTDLSTGEPSTKPEL